MWIPSTRPLLFLLNEGLVQWHHAAQGTGVSKEFWIFFFQLEADRVSSLCLIRQGHESWIKVENLSAPWCLHLSHSKNCLISMTTLPKAKNSNPIRFKSVSTPLKLRPSYTSFLLSPREKKGEPLMLLGWKTERRNQFCRDVTWQLATETGMTPLMGHFLVVLIPDKMLPRWAVR